MRLDWKTEITPVITEYMARMMHAGYPEKYRRDTYRRDRQEPSEYMTKWLKMTEAGNDPCTGPRILRESKDRMKNIERKQAGQIKKWLWHEKIK